MNTHKREGRGYIIRPDGSLQEGHFVAGFAQGRGRLINPEGEVYVGQFMND
jgi:hypothetical protein